MRLLIVEVDDFLADTAARSFEANMHSVKRVRDARSIRSIRRESGTRQRTPTVSAGTDRGLQRELLRAVTARLGAGRHRAPILI